MTCLYRMGDVTVTATYEPGTDGWVLDASYKGVEVERTSTKDDCPKQAAQKFGEKIKNWKESPKPVLTLIDYDPFLLDDVAVAVARGVGR
jgi:hypothetical protein